MLPRTLSGSSALARLSVRLARPMATTTATATTNRDPATSPVEALIRQRLASLRPSRLDIFNDSHLHAHHAPMAGGAGQSGETHFRLVITSEEFIPHRQPARHRMVYALLDDEMKRAGGIHALQLRTMTPDEEKAREAKKKGTDAAVGCGRH